jgi:hypothetical protein
MPLRLPPTLGEIEESDTFASDEEALLPTIDETGGLETSSEAFADSAREALSVSSGESLELEAVRSGRDESWVRPLQPGDDSMLEDEVEEDAEVVRQLEAAIAGHVPGQQQARQLLRLGEVVLAQTAQADPSGSAAGDHEQSLVGQHIAQLRAKLQGPTG